jgi:hypothetical protein
MNDPTAARGALEAYDNWTELIGADGHPLVGSVERADWLIAQLRPYVTAPTESESEQANTERPLVSLKALSHVIDGYSYDWSWLAARSLTIRRAVQFSDDTEVERKESLVDFASEADPGGAVLLTFGYWDDGEEHDAPKTDHPSARRLTYPGGHFTDYTDVSLTRRQLSNALHDMAAGKIGNNPYHIAAATDLINDPDGADGDYDTTDILIQWATFGELVYS